MQTQLAKGTLEQDPGVPGPGPTHGGSKGLALRGLRSPAQGSAALSTRTRGLLKEKKRKRKKKFSFLHKITEQRCSVLRCDSAEWHPSNVPFLSHALSSAGLANAFPFYAVPGLVELGAASQVVLSSNSFE